MKACAGWSPATRHNRENSEPVMANEINNTPDNSLQYLCIRNWERWQSYRHDRGHPPWIKVHRRLLRNPNWVALTDAQKGQLVSIWMLAADQNGVIPDSPTLIARLCCLEHEPDLSTLINLGFLDAKMTPRRKADRRQVVPPKAETETETEKKDCAPRKVESEKEKGFLDFYSAYPKKKSKKDALKAYIAARKDASHEAIMAGLSNAKRDWNDPKFIPYPASWLRAGGWEDEGQKPKITNGFAALPNTPEFDAWKAFLNDTGQSALIRILNQREMEGRAFDFQSQWPPNGRNS